MEKIVALMSIMVLLVVAANANPTELGDKAEVQGHHHHPRHVAALDKCFGQCYPKCSVRNTQPTFCATLCIGKCKKSESIPDNLCNCTYTCSRFKCKNVGTDAKKVQKCVNGCSKLCNINV